MFRSLFSIDRPLGSGSAISLSSVGESFDYLGSCDYLLSFCVLTVQTLCSLTMMS